MNALLAALAALGVEAVAALLVWQLVEHHTPGDILAALWWVAFFGGIGAVWRQQRRRERTRS